VTEEITIVWCPRCRETTLSHRTGRCLWCDAKTRPICPVCDEPYVNVGAHAERCRGPLLDGEDAENAAAMRADRHLDLATSHAAEHTP
jgi:predicted amidophosphoribosyltransferase